MTLSVESGHAPSRLAAAVVDALVAFEEASRMLDPVSVPMLRRQLEARTQDMDDARRVVAEHGHYDRDESVERLVEASGLILEAVERFGDGQDMTRAFMAVLKALRKCCQAQETLFHLRHEFPVVDRYFLEPGVDMPGGRSGAGIVHRSPGHDPYGRGGYSLFVPETRFPGRARPLVVALHGGHGHGRDFLWTWVREARSRDLLLMAPTSVGRSWSLVDIDADAPVLLRNLDEVCSCYAVDRDRILLTGMSDGGTFALGLGIGRKSPTSAIAPVSCVLPPVDLNHAGGKRILWVHGARDWMFPAGRAAKACEELSKAGADVRLRIVPDLSHAYPREENDAILKWFDHAV